MSKVCFYTVQFLEEARYTADNLLIAKMMSDYGKPLDQDLNFYVKSSNNDMSLFFEALNILFQSVKVNEGYDEKMHENTTNVLLSSKEIKRWLQLTKLIEETSMYDAFRMVQIGLETTLSTSSDYFDGTLEGEFADECINLTFCGSVDYVLFHEILESVIQFIESLNKQLQIWEVYYYEHTNGNKRDAYHAS